ncbi:MAG: Gfo/Idh/MocA family oxidoreductase [Kiritimatiellae bacterium]|nr:Gfo/Idh/MocA family oxidoreductase [Kiritimatiellia bacterium]
MNMNRRGFLSAMLAAGAYPLLPGCFSSKAYVANGKVRLAAIGCGAQAWFDLKKLAGNKDICEVVALCDTDIGAPHTEEALKRFPNLPRFQDFRKMFDRMADQIDAVLIGIPDHSHFCAAMHAMRLGKAVYVEKPLAHSFRECELLMAAEEKYGVVTQMGNQGHSGANYYQYRDYVQNGVIKDVKKVVAHMNMQRRWHKWGGKTSSYPRGEVMPETLDWEVWCNAAPYHDFSKDLAYGEWRCWYDYGNGCMGDWGAHILDCVHRFTLRGALPTEVSISNVTGWNQFVFPIQDTLTMKFDDVTLEWYEGLDNKPPLPEGFRYADNKGLFPASTANDGLIDPPLKPGKEIYLADGTVWQGLSHSATLVRVGAQDEKVPAFEKAGSDHWRNFLLAVKGEEEARSPFRVTAPLSEVFCLGVIAQRLNRGFKFDPVGRKAVGDAEVGILLKGSAPREGWEEYYRV